MLYALLEGISSYYSIERSDISGCLHCTYENRKLHTTFLIYDTVLGGAGHAARIANGGKSAIIGILKVAYRVVKECTCGGENGDVACYSCLCNYEFEGTTYEASRYVFNGVIYGYEGSTAQAYAKKYGIKFMALLSIVKQPKDVCAANGETASVTVKATGEGLTYK